MHFVWTLRNNFQLPSRYTDTYISRKISSRFWTHIFFFLHFKKLKSSPYQNKFNLISCLMSHGHTHTHTHTNRTSLNLQVRTFFVSPSISLYLSIFSVVFSFSIFCWHIRMLTRPPYQTRYFITAVVISNPILLFFVLFFFFFPFFSFFLLLVHVKWAALLANTSCINTALLKLNKSSYRKCHLAAGFIVSI